jgi:hypothetical protein
MSKIETLAKFLDCEVETISVSKYDDNCFMYRDEKYQVYTGEEADEAAKDAILSSVWAFNPEFLASHCDGIDTDDTELIQSNNKCEDNNKILTKLIDDHAAFVQDAISSDGRGHFLSHYDGEEHEVGDYFIYRLN